MNIMGTPTTPQLDGKNPAEVHSFAGAPDLTYLRVSKGGGESRVLLPSGNTWRIGRSRANDVLLSADSVPRRHVMIQRTEGREYYLNRSGKHQRLPREWHTRKRPPNSQAQRCLKHLRSRICGKMGS